MHAVPPGLHASDTETATQSRERGRVALACREMGNYLTTAMDSRFDDVKDKVEEVKANVDLILCGLSLLLGKDWQTSVHKSHYITSHPECFEIHSEHLRTDGYGLVADSQPDVEAPPEKEALLEHFCDAANHCSLVLDFDANIDENRSTIAQARC